MFYLLYPKFGKKPETIKNPYFKRKIGVTGFEEFALSKKYVNTLFFEGVFYYYSISMLFILSVIDRYKLVLFE